MVTSLVIKPTVKCNFKCTFCSSTVIGDNATDEVSVEDILRFLDRYPQINTIIVNGGDPLMMPPSYYEQILDYIDTHGRNIILSLTTNLWAFYKKPEKWTPVFTHPMVRVMTSFQYGDKRLKGDLTPFTEEEFWAVSDLLLSVVDYRPDFIAVVDYDNAHLSVDTVRLAKEMDVDCKLNYAMASGVEVEYKGITMGNEGSLFLLADMYKIYVDIHDLGLAPWEFNTRQMMVKLKDEPTSCPLNRSCDCGIRTMQPSGRYYSCPAMADDDLYRIDFEKEMEGELFTPLQQDFELQTMKNSCYGCPMFGICNSCKKTIRDHKRLGLVETHCRKMKKLAPDIIRINGMEGQLEPTPYVDETQRIDIIDVG